MIYIPPRMVLAGAFLAVFAGTSIQAQTHQAKSPDQGAQLYASNCAFCHGADGKGGRAPAIATLPKVIALSDQDLINIVHNGEVSQGMPSFPDLGSQGTQAVVRYLRALQGVTGAAPATKLMGNPDAGRELFFGKAECSTCHMVNGKGGFIARELTSYAQGVKPEDIQQAIVNPDAQVEPDSRVVEVQTKGGQNLSGVLRAEDNLTLTLQTKDGRYHFLTRSNLAAVNDTGHSLMPRDYGTRLTHQELNDLVSFLMVTAKSGPAKAPPRPHKPKEDDGD